MRASLQCLMMREIFNRRSLEIAALTPRIVISVSAIQSYLTEEEEREAISQVSCEPVQPKDMKKFFSNPNNFLSRLEISTEIGEECGIDIEQCLEELTTNMSEKEVSELQGVLGEVGTVFKNNHVETRELEVFILDLVQDNETSRDISEK